MDTFTFTISEKDGILSTVPTDLRIGSMYDHLAQRIEFKRPPGRENDTLILYVRPAGEDTYRLDLGTDSGLDVERSLTQWNTVDFQVAFIRGGVETEHSTVNSFSFRDSLTGSGPIPPPWPQPWDAMFAQVETETAGSTVTQTFKNPNGEAVGESTFSVGGEGSYSPDEFLATYSPESTVEAGKDAAGKLRLLAGGRASETDPVYSADKPSLATKADVAAEKTAREGAISAIEEDIATVGETASDALSAANAAQRAVDEEATVREADVLALTGRVGQLETDAPKHALKTETDAQIEAANTARADGDAALQTQVTANNAGLSTLQATVNSMAGGAVYLDRLEVATADVTQQMLDDWAISQGYTKPFKSNITIPDAENHEWAYNADLGLWKDTGVFVASTATQESLGIVKGTSAALGISINGAGEMALNTGGKVLTDINFTSEKDEKLAGIAENANKTQFTSQLTNDSGFVTTEDPRLSDARPASDVPAWAKNDEKPTYSKTEVGLGSVDNTSDLDKPISTAAQAALDAQSSRIAALESQVAGVNVQLEDILGV